MIDCWLCMTIHMYSTYLDSVFTLLVDSVRVCGGGGGLCFMDIDQFHLVCYLLLTGKGKEEGAEI